MAKKLLKVAAVINLVIGGLILLFSLLIINISFIRIISMVGIIGAAIRLGIGATFLKASEKENDEIFKWKGYVLAASIVSVLTGHIITFILGIIAYTYMNDGVSKETVAKRVLTEEEKADKRLKNLLALGCGLVILAGVIFAMTTWTTLSGAGKTIALICATVFFFVLSYFSENKFGLKTSSITYYILANTFCICTFVSAGYFEVFGRWFSINGEGKYLYIGLLFILGSILTYFSYLKYNRKNLFYIFDFSVLMALISLLNFFEVGKDIVLFTVISILAIFILIPVKGDILKKTKEFSNVLLTIASFMLFTFIMELNAGDRIIFYLMSFGVSFITCYYLATVNKELFYEIFSPIFTVGTAFGITAIMGADNQIIFLQLILITVIVYAIGYYKKDQKNIITSTSVVCDLALLYILIDSIKLGYEYYSVIAGLALLGISLSAAVSKSIGRYYFEIVLEPVKVIFLSYAVYNLLYKFDYTEEALFFSVIGLIFSIICIFRKEFMKKIYFISSILVITWTVLANVKEFSPIVQILSVISLGLLLVITFKTEEKRLIRCKELVYGLLLVAIALAALNIFGHFDLELIGIILLTIIYSALFIGFNKNDIFRCFTIVALLLPYTIILPISIWNSNVNYILYSLPWLALIFIYTRGFLTSASLKVVNGIEIVALSIWYWAVISEIALEITIFVGLVSFAGILVGYRSNKWISLYYTGVVFLILNTIIQLKDFWTSIPIWAYLLIAGLILIGIVSYKEYSKVRKNDEEVYEPEIVEGENFETNNLPLDERTIVAGSLLYIVFIPILLQIIL